MIGVRMVKGLDPPVMGSYGCALFAFGSTNTAQYFNRTLNLTGELTWRGWVKVTSVDTNPTRFINYSANTRLTLIPGGSPTAAFTIKGSVDCATTDASSTSSTTITCGVWHFIVMTYSNSGDRKVRLYVDAVEVAYSGGQVAGVGAIVSLSALRIGTSESGTGYLTANLGETAIDNVVRTLSEIETMYRSGFPEDDSYVLLHVGGIDTFGKDSTVNANHLTANGSPIYTTEFFKSQG